MLNAGIGQKKRKEKRKKSKGEKEVEFLPLLLQQSEFSPSPFLSAAQPTDQGEESVVLLLVVVGGGPFFSLPCTVFWGVKRQKLCLKRGVKRQRLCHKYYFPRRR